MSTAFKIQTTTQTTLETSDFSYFGNQISGHSCLLKGSSNPQYIYKPYDRNEADFYEYISKNEEHALAAFIPSYYGILTLPKSILEEFALRICGENSPLDLGEEASKEVDIQPDSSENLQNPEQESKSIQSRIEWFKNLFMTRFNDNNTRFLKLQDLTSDIESPCMLDLKMGSVAYNAEKLAHQAIKLSATTSSTLKFRVCGLQTKNPKTRTDYFRDKYWGRMLKQQDINSALALFFYDGRTLRRNLIQQFIRRLKDLAEAIKRSPGFRFYSVSLLLIYDSSLDDEEFEDDGYTETFLKNKFRLKLIDFAKSKYGQHSGESDVDLLTGIENLIKCFTEIQNNQEIKPCFS